MVRCHKVLAGGCARLAGGDAWVLRGLLVGQEGAEGELLSLLQALVEVLNRFAVLLQCVNGIPEFLLQTCILQCLVVDDCPFILHYFNRFIDFFHELLYLVVLFLDCLLKILDVQL